MNSTNTTTFFNNFTTNSTAILVDKSTVRISIEEFEELISYKKICQDLFKEYGGVLDE